MLTLGGCFFFLQKLKCSKNILSPAVALMVKCDYENCDYHYNKDRQTLDKMILISHFAKCKRDNKSYHGTRKQNVLMKQYTPSSNKIQISCLIHSRSQGHYSELIGSKNDNIQVIPSEIQVFPSPNWSKYTSSSSKFTSSVLHWWRKTPWQYSWY